MHQDRCKTYWLGGTNSWQMLILTLVEVKDTKAKNKYTHILYVGKIILKRARYHYKMTKAPL